MLEFRYALSVSPFTERMLAEGVAFSDGVRTAATVRELQELFVAHGATEVYARIATKDVTGRDGGGAEHGMLRGLERAALARDLDVPFNPELGLFASYGDVLSYQEPPDFSDCPEIQLRADWFELTVDEMADAIRTYAAQAAARIIDTGVRVGTWNLGNEVESGICGVTPPMSRGTWKPYRRPDTVDPEIARGDRWKLIMQASESERIDWLSQHVWPHVGRLLAAAAEGVRQADRHARISTHIAGANPSTTAAWTAFWESMAEAGYRPDVFGTSMYPSGPVRRDLADLLRDGAIALQRRWGKPTFIAEYAYPTGDVQGPFPYGEEVPGYPLGEAGQAAYLEDLVDRGIAEGWLDGIRPWAPDLADGHWAPLSFFTLDGRVARANAVLGRQPGHDETVHTKENP